MIAPSKPPCSIGQEALTTLPIHARWNTPPQNSGRIQRLDIDCGAVYINEEQQAAYAPFGLIIFLSLPKSVMQFDQIKSELEQLEGSLECGQRQ